MISERKLRRIAARAGMGVGQAEYEYVLLCALDGLSRTSPLDETFCLKGGTALRLVYFPDWRRSIDLDFSVLPSFPGEQLRAGLERWLREVERLHGVRMTLRDLHKVDGAARLRVSFTGPLRHPARLLLDITLDEPVLLPPQRRPVIGTIFAHPRPLVLTYSLEEILAEKLRSILQRGKARDYYDVWRLLQEKRDALSLDVARRVLWQKCKHKGLPQPAGAAPFLDPQALEAAAPYWGRDLAEQVPSGSLPSWDRVVDELPQLLGDFFS